MSDKSKRYITEWDEVKGTWVTTVLDVNSVVEFRGNNPKETFDMGLRGSDEKEFKPLDVIKNQVGDFVDKLSSTDVCKLSINTEVYMGVDSTGPIRAKGDEYLALVIRKINVVPDSFVLQENMKYPCKDVYNFFCEVEK